MAHARIKRVFDELWDLHKAKDADYAGNEPLSNFQICEQFGIPAWKGAAIRMADKWSRFISLMRKDGSEVKGKTIDDTLKDLAVYAVIVKVLREEAEREDLRSRTYGNMDSKENVDFNGNRLRKE